GQYLRDRGGLLFMSAGNGGTYNDETTFPDYSSFVVVGATSQSDVKSSFSEYGPFVDITAPGESIRTTYLNGSYVNYSGTSFSSPMTAGLGALIYSVNPNFTPQEVEDIIFNTAVDLGVAGDDDSYGHGRIDANAAIISAMNYVVTPNEPPVANATATPISGIAPLEVLFDGSTSTDDGTIVSYQWSFGDGSSASDVNPLHTYTDAGTYSATLTVTDNQGAETTSSAITIQVDPDTSVIVAPSNLTAGVDTNKVTLNWTDNSNSETAFVIERAKKIRGKYNFVELTTVVTDTIEYIDTVAETGDYKYRIKAINDTISTDYSNEVAVKVETLGTTPPPEPEPDTLVAPVLSHTLSGTTVNLILSHTCPSGEVCSYDIERGDAKVRGQINFSAYGRSDSSLLQENIVESSGTFYYRVRATTANDVSDFSNVISARIK
ncbi:S8 family serine peptidase, partial [Sulfurovum sp. bin170]|uniref:S8 family serine peptidase n=1 Tax=Sulfurovum sp. bin170 TaxID=2695268 RepID=UPI0013DF211B